jgi:hypothetical protein
MPIEQVFLTFRTFVATCYNKILALKHAQALIEHMLNSFSKNNIPLLPHL